MILKKATFISYLDLNNLYGWAMSGYLSNEKFKWLQNVDEFDIMSICEKKSKRIFITG